MTDHQTRQQRSRNMASIRGKDTRPELRVRSALHRLGCRFRLHRRDLPGTPDVVLPKYRTVVFVHGCFWHRHPGCPRSFAPATRSEFWRAKLDRNVVRDAENRRALEAAGWRVVVIWECETRDQDALQRQLGRLVDTGFAEAPAPLPAVAEDRASYTAGGAAGGERTRRPRNGHED